MDNQRQELDRLRKIKRLRELEAREGIKNDDSTIDTSGNNIRGMGTGQSGTGAQQVEDKGFLDSVGDFFTGDDRETRATQELPEVGSGGLLHGEDKLKMAAIVPALLTATDPQEMGKILNSNFPHVGIQQDPKGNWLATNNNTGVKVVLNKPGVSQIDIMQGLGIASAFMPSGRVAGAGIKGTAKLAAAAGLTSAAIEGIQELSGGDFDASQVVMDTATAGVLDAAFKVAKLSGRKLKDVLRDDAKIDPDQLVKSFDQQFVKSSFSKSDRVAPEFPQRLKKATQADLTPEALDKIKLAESQGVQLTKAQATGDFNAVDAEQTLLKSASSEGGKARQFADEQQQQLQAATKEFTDKFGGSSRLADAKGEAVEFSARDKGAQIQEAITDVKKLTDKEVSELYTLAGEAGGDDVILDSAKLVNIADDAIVNLPVSSATRETLDTALAKYGLIGDKSVKSSRNISNVFDGDKKIQIIGDVTPLTLSNAEGFRQALNRAASDDLTGSAKGVINELDNQIEQALSSGAKSQRSELFTAARDAFANKKATFSAKDIVDDLVGFKKGTSTPKVDPESVINRIVKGDKAVTNIRKVKEVLLENPTAETKKAWRSIQAESIGDILSQSINKDTLNISGARLNSAINKYKPEALKELLGKKQYAELKRLQDTIGTVTISPSGTQNPSGTFTKLLNNMERLGNLAGAGQFNMGSMVVGGVAKGKEIARRKKTLDGIVNTTLKEVSEKNPNMSRTQKEKLANILAFLQIRELDKEQNQ